MILSLFIASLGWAKFDTICEISNPYMERMRACARQTKKRPGVLIAYLDGTRHDSNGAAHCYRSFFVYETSSSLGDKLTVWQEKNGKLFRHTVKKSAKDPSFVLLNVIGECRSRRCTSQPIGIEDMSSDRMKFETNRAKLDSMVSEGKGLNTNFKEESPNPQWLDDICPPEATASDTPTSQPQGTTEGSN